MESLERPRDLEGPRLSGRKADVDMIGEALGSPQAPPLPRYACPKSSCGTSRHHWDLERKGRRRRALDLGVEWRLPPNGLSRAALAVLEGRSVGSRILTPFARLPGTMSLSAGDWGLMTPWILSSEVLLDALTAARARAGRQ